MKTLPSLRHTILASSITALLNWHSAQADTWDGGSTTSNLPSDAANWVNDVLPNGTGNLNGINVDFGALTGGMQNTMNYNSGGNSGTWTFLAAAPAMTININSNQFGAATGPNVFANNSAFTQTFTSTGTPLLFDIGGTTASRIFDANTAAIVMPGFNVRLDASPASWNIDFRGGATGSISTGGWAGVGGPLAGKTIGITKNGTGSWAIRGAIANIGAAAPTTVTVSQGTLIFGGANTYTGTTTISSGILQVGEGAGGGTTGTLGSGGVMNDASLVFNRSNAVAAANIIGGAGAVSQIGAGTTTLSGENTYSGATTVSAGRLIMAAPTSLGSVGGLNVATATAFVYRPVTAGALDFGTGGLTLAGGSTLGVVVGGTLGQSAITSTAVAAASGTITVNIEGVSGAAITPGTHNLLTVGGGLTAGGATYVPRIVNATNFSSSNFQQTNTALTLDVVAQTELTTAYWRGGVAAAGSNVWALSQGTATNWASDAGGTPAPVVPGVGADVIFSATGATNQGAMVLGADMPIKSLTINDPSAVTLNADGSTLTLATAAGLTVNSGAGAVTVNAPVRLGAAQSLTHNGSNALTLGGGVNNGGFLLTATGSGATAITGGVTGTGGLTKIGTGTLTLDGTNDFTGTTTVTAGTLRAGTATTLAAGLVIGGTVAENPVLAINGGSLTVGGGLNVASSATSPAGPVGAIYLSSGSLTTAAVQLGRSTLTTFTGVANFYQTGGTYSQTSGLFGLGSREGLTTTAATGTASLSGGAFTGSIQLGATTGGRGGTAIVNVDGTANVTATALNIGNASTASGGGVQGTVNLGSGMLTAPAFAELGNATNKNTLSVNFHGGTLRASAASANFFPTAFTNTTVRLYAGGAMFDTQANAVTIANVLSNPANSGISTPGITTSDTTTVFSAPPALTFTGGTGSGGSGYATLDSAGKITGIVITNVGTYTAAPTLSVAGSTTVFAAPTLNANNTGGLTKSGSGTLTLTGANTYTGATNINAGNLEVSGVSGSISGTTSLKVGNTGTLLLSGGNERVNNSAAVNLNGGTLAFANALSTATETLGAFTLSASSTIDFGTGAGDGLLFAGLAAHTAGTTLSILNWSGTPNALGTAGTDDRLIFNGDTTAYNAFKAAFAPGEISFSGFGPGYAALQFNGNTQFEIVAVPEPSSLALLGGAALLGLRGFRGRRGFASSLTMKQSGR